MLSKRIGFEPRFDEFDGATPSPMTDVPDEPKLEVHTNSRQSSHLLVISIGFAVSGSLGIMMLVNGLATENGFPLSYFAASVFLIGAAFAFLAEWRSRRAFQ